MAMQQQHQGTHVPAVRAVLEKQLGILERVSPIDFGWGADIRKRFTDFLVYEIRKDKSVVHLSGFTVPEPVNRKLLSDGAHKGPSNALSAEDRTNHKLQTPEAEIKIEPISEEDRAILESLIGEAATSHLLEVDQAIQTKQTIRTPTKFPSMDDREKRGRVHQEIRRVFRSRFETTTDKTGIITAVPANNGHGPYHRGGHGHGHGHRFPHGNRSFGQLGGEYIHCTMYKENKDTMDALNIIARMLKVKVGNFGFSGTKDRRAATVQRISIFRQREHNLTWLNGRMSGVRLGDFKHSKYPVQLGQHAGNEFIITLKNCHHARGSNSSLAVRTKMIEESVVMGLLYLYKNGFLNYFGLQRFGTHSIGTHELGMKILKNDFEGAVEDILHVDPQAMSDMFSEHATPSFPASVETAANRDEQNRAKAIASWRATGNADAALGYLPKRFGAETSIIRHLGREGQRRDYMGALLTITKGMRQMYIHAYQSYVWNFVASRRWSKYGARVIEGDLILLDNQAPDLAYDDETRDTSADWENFYAQVQPLTAEEAASGKFSIFDIVLPTPGFDVIYPKNDIGEFYKTFMSRPENGGLDPYDMRRRQKEFSLSGNYRPLVGRFLERPEYLVRTYSDDNEQMYPTDVDLIMQKKALAEEARQREARASAKSVARWRDFAQNPAKYDKAQDDEDRRRRAEEPLNVDGTRINETWVQTGLDGSDKRIKVARHLFETVEHNDEEPDQESKALIALSPKDSGQDTSSSVFDTIRPLPAPATLPTPTLPASPFSPFPGSEFPPPAFQNMGQHAGASFFDTPAVKNDENKYLFSLLQGGVDGPPLAPADGLPTIKTEPADGHYGSFATTNQPAQTGKLDTGDQKPNPMALRALSPGLPTTPASGAVVTHGPKSPLPPSSAGLSSNGAPSTGPVAPEFSPIPENPFEAFSPDHYATGLGGGSGHKTAVILKFQLRSSSYATVVLRELMGTVPDESHRSSRGSTPGYPMGGHAR